MWHKTSSIIAKSILALFLLIGLSCIHNSEDDTQRGIVYINPRVYNVEYKFELCPNKDSIDPSRDLKLWIPVPREWDNQKTIKIISVEPEPQGTYTDPEYGNNILFWDFGKASEQNQYVVKIKYRAEVSEIYCDVDPDEVGSYDSESEEYQLYTRSTQSATISPEVEDIARSVIGDEKNPYLQARMIFDYVVKYMSFDSDVRRTSGSSLNGILNNAVTDPVTGEAHFKGQCDHYSLLYVSLCRAAGIPARGVCGFVGWGPWIKAKDLTLRSKRHTQLTSEGLAATRLYGPFDGHIWAEFYLPSIGWIPADPTWNQFGYQGNTKLIVTKGRDVLIGPNVSPSDNGVYGDQWIPLYNGRANTIGWGVWNIARIRVANAKIIHTSDPFPANAFAEYSANLYPEDDQAEKLRNWRKEQILSFYNATKRNTTKGNILGTDHRLRAGCEAYLCQVLRDITGDKKFQQIFDDYLKLRLTSGKPVSTYKFREISEQVNGESLGFFFEDWLGNTSLPRLCLEHVIAERREKEWRVYGRLIQGGKTFHIPVKLALETESGQVSQIIWLDSVAKDFEFITPGKPAKLIVDPDLQIPTIRWMPPHLGHLWYSYPEFSVIYGTLSESESNKKTAEIFAEEFAGLGHDIIKADTAVTESDLQKSLILFGRPETNKIALLFYDFFPVKFEKDRFTWQGVVYNKSSQGIALIIENPLDTLYTINLYAGLSGEATLMVCDKSDWQKELDGYYLIDLSTSYIIYDHHSKLVSGDWEDTDSDLVWNFE